MTDENPWLNINVPPDQGLYRTNRVAIETPHDFFWAKNFVGKCCLILNCENISGPKITLPKLKGIEFNIVSEGGKISLIAILTDDTARDLFRTFCSDLIVSSKKVKTKDSVALINAMKSRIERWQDLMSRSKDKILSESEQIGLFGELVFLRDILMQKLDLINALTAWEPDGEQDFGWSGKLFEIKTQKSTTDKKVKINSLEQLDTISGEIWLIHQTLALAETNESSGLSLRELVNSINHICNSDIFALDKLNSLLAEKGYEDNDAYSEPKFGLQKRSFFMIDETFPSLTRTGVPLEIKSAVYVLDISALDAWIRDEKTFLEIFN